MTLSRRDTVALAVLCLIGVGTPLWLATAAGQFGLPSNDDWVYARGAQSLFRSGVIEMPGHTAAAIGQLVMVQPLLWLSGGSSWAFPVFGLLMTLLGVVAAYLLARRFVGVGSAFLAVLLIEVFPGFARESASFMTDIPAAALMTVCLLLGSIWLDGRRTRVLLASLGVGLLAVAIREFAVAAPISVLLVGWVHGRGRERRWLGAATAIFGAVVAAIVVGGFAVGGRGVDVEHGALLPLLLMGPAFTTLAAALLPATALVFGAARRRLRIEDVLGSAALVLLALMLLTGPFVGNLWMADGALQNGMLSGVRDPVIVEPGWQISERLAAFAAICLGALLFAWVRRALADVRSLSSGIARLFDIARAADGLLVLFLVVYGAEIMTFAAVGGPTFDRYLFPMVCISAVVLLRGAPASSALTRRDAVAHAAVAWLVISAFLIAANSFAYDAARFREGDSAVGMGYDARLVDAGYDWVGYNSPASGQPPGVLLPGDSPLYLAWYYQLLSASPPCVMLSNTPLDHPRLSLIRVERSAYRRYLFFGPAEPLYLYALVRDGCPKPPVVVGLQDQP